MQRSNPQSLLVAALFAVSMGWSGSMLYQLRAEAGLIGTHTQGARPVLSCTHLLLGGFRGLLTDMLWMRAIRLQEQHAYTELAQLAEWITELEPDNGDAWAYLAWNMAYNLAHEQPSADLRWRWIQQALSLLAYNGRRCAPQDPVVAAELAWLLFHRIGSDYDPAGATYRRLFAELAARHDATGYQLPDPLRQRAEARYGPLDQRDPIAHAVCWALESRRYSRAQAERETADRLLYQSLTALFFRRIDRNGPTTPTTPACFPGRLAPAMQAYEDALKTTPAIHVAEAYAYFLVKATKALEAQGNRDTAVQTRTRLRALSTQYAPRSNQP